MQRSSMTVTDNAQLLAANENARMTALRDVDLLDAQYGATFDRFARLACAVTGADGAMISLRMGSEAHRLGAHGVTEDALIRLTPPMAHDEPVCDSEGVQIGTMRLLHSCPDGLAAPSRALLGELAESVATSVELYRSMRDVHRIATTDCLTEVGNRTYFFHQLRAEAARARRGQAPLSVLYCDCDGFRMVNNTLGHAAGDALLREITAVMRENLRASDTLGRLGGDEFGLVLPEIGPVAARAIAERILLACRTLTRRYEHPVSVSFGVVTFLAVPDDVADMVEAADAAMYDAKHAGRDRVVARVVRSGVNFGVINALATCHAAQ